MKIENKQAKFNNDDPIISSKDDEYNTEIAAQAMADYIEKSASPLTISIQGPWGCGKSSFMKLVDKKLSDRNYDKHYIMSWDYFLNNNDYGVEGFISEMINSISDNKYRKTLRKSAYAANHIFSKGLSTFVSIKGGDGQTVREIFEKNPNTVSNLKNQLDSLIENNNKTHVFFVDDLDRVDPKSAVDILDLLKNIFNLDRCIFLVAIDFDVVAKGLMQKYNLKEHDDHVYRDYFDKVFQFSYQIPLKIEESVSFLKKGLRNCNFWPDSESKEYGKLRDEERLDFNTSCRFAASLVKYNPRKIKRLVNYITFKLQADKNDTEYINKGSGEIKSICLLFTALEVAYPKFVEHLYKFPLFYEDDKKEEALKDICENIDTKILKDDWHWNYKYALKESEFSNSSEEIFKCLKFIYEIITSADRPIDIRKVFGIIDHVQTSNGEVGMKAESLDDNQTSRRFSEILFNDHKGDFEKATKPKVLHLGCQDACLSKMILDSNPDAYIVAVEMQNELFLVAEKSLNEYDKNNRHKVIYKQLEYLDYHNEFDFIVSVTAAHWMREECYKRAYKFLKPGGYIFIEQSGSGTYEDMHKVLIDVVKNYSPNDERADISDIQPFYLPTKKKLTDDLKKLKFKDVNVTTKIKVNNEINNLDKEKIYKDYSCTNALPYLKRFDDFEKERIASKFIEACKLNETETTGNYLWISAKK